MCVSGKLIFNEMMMLSTLYLINTLSMIFFRDINYHCTHAHFSDSNPTSLSPYFKVLLQVLII
jgi:hypothetical protein